MNFTGTAGNDNLTGTSSADTFTMSQGGDDTVHGGNGNDVFNYGATFNELDTINGGSGNDVLNVDGNYASSTFAIATGTLVSVETMHMAAGHDYKFQTDSGAVASGARLKVDGSDLGASDTLSFDGSGETTGQFTLEGGLGDDDLRGGSKSDTFYDRNGGNDTAFGGGGNDVFNFGAALTGADRIDGGTGANNVVNITGDYTGSHGLVLTTATLNDVNTLHLGDGFSYHIDSADEGDQQAYTIDASALTGSNALVLDATHNAHSNLTLKGGAGDDTFNFKAEYFGGAIDGGTGDDAVLLNGDYSSVRPFEAGFLVNVEHLSLGAGHSYNFDLFDGNLTASQTLTVNGSALGAGDFLAFAALNTIGHLTLLGGAGDDLIADSKQGDIIKTGAGNDTIQPNGGADTVQAGDGDDLILYTDNSFAASASLDGGNGNDELNLDGDYSGGVTFATATMKNVESVVVQGDFSFNLTLADGNISSTQAFQIDGDYTSASDRLVFNDSAETNAAVLVDGGIGNDVITAGGGTHQFHGSDGSDFFFMLGNLGASDIIDGGAGTDTMILNGNYASGLTFGSVSSIEDVDLVDGHSYKLTTTDFNVGAGQTMLVTAAALTGANTLTFVGTAEQDGNFILDGGAGADHLVAGAGNDTLDGNGGGDTLQGHGGNDIFVYGAASDSTSTGYDSVVNINFARSHFDITGSVSAIDATIASGTLSTSSFDANLASAVDAAHLAAGHAVLFTPNAGTLSGHTFLVIDQNGTAGYQAGADLVIDLMGATNLGNLAAGSFI